MKIDTAEHLLAIWAGAPQHTAIEAIADRIVEATRDAILADLAECVASPRWQETYQIAVSQEDLTSTLDSLIDRAITHKGKSMNTYRITNPTFFAVYSVATSAVLWHGDVPTPDDALAALEEAIGEEVDEGCVKIIKLKTRVIDPRDGMIYTIDIHGDYVSACGHRSSIGLARLFFCADAE
jgi:hypothetical protein